MSFDQTSLSHDWAQSMASQRRQSIVVEAALGLATEAMKSAAEAMSNATEALSQNKPPETSTKPQEPAPSELRASQPPFEPSSSSLPRRPKSTLPPPKRRSQTLKIVTTSPESKFSKPQLPQKALPPPVAPPAKKANSNSHIDLLDAAEAIKPREPSSPFPSLDFPKRNYEEDVANRNIAGFWPLTFTYSLTNSPPCELDATDHAILNRPTSMPRHSKFCNKPREIAFVFSMIASNLLTQAGCAQSIAPMPIIGASFLDMNPARLSWYAAAYTLTIGAFILPSGRLGDIYGHKCLYIIGWLWFAIFSVLAGFAPVIELKAPKLKSEAFFCFCRAMQGIGPALLLPNALAILGRTYENGNRQNVMFAVFGAAAPTGFVLGCAFSSLVSELLRWPFAYWFLGMVCFLMALLCRGVIPRGGGSLHEQSEKRRSFWLWQRRDMDGGERVGWGERWRQLDGNGCVLGVSGLVLVGFAWNQGPVVGWETPYTYFTMIIGIIVLLAFFFIESKASNPLLPLSSISHHTILVLTCIAAGWSCFGIYIFYTYSFLLQTRHLAPSTIAIMFVPAAISGIFAAMSTGLLFNNLGPHLLLFLSMLAFCTGILLITLVPVPQVYWGQTFVSVVLMPWGMDMSFPSAVVLISDGLRREVQGIAASLVMTVVFCGVSVGLGVAGTMERALVGEGVEVVWVLRCVFFLGVGLSGLGTVVAGVALVMGKIGWKRKKVNEVNLETS